MNLRPRFSLRTLMLAALLCGSGAVLWWDWGPWALAYSIHESGPVESAGFCNDERFIYTMVPEGKTEKREVEAIVLNVRDGRTGELRYSLKNRPAQPYDSYEIYQKYIRLDRRLEGRGAVWRINDGQEIPDKSQKSRAQFTFSPNENYAVVSGRDENEEYRWIATFPELKKIVSLKNNREVVFSPDEKWFAVEEENKCVVVTSLPEGRSYTLPIEEEKVVILFSGDSDSLVISWTPNPFGGVTKPANAQIYDLRTGRLKAVLPGAFANGASIDIFDHGRKVILLGYAIAIPNSDRYVLWDIETSRKLKGWNDPKLQLVYLCGDVIFERRETEDLAYDAKTLNLIWQRSDCDLSNGCRYGVQYQESGETVFDVQTGRQLFQLSPSRWPKERPDAKYTLSFAEHSGQFITRESLEPAVIDRYGENGSRITVWNMRRPAKWWGVAWLPEFWATLVLAAGFCWSVIRDRRVLNARTRAQ